MTITVKHLFLVVEFECWERREAPIWRCLFKWREHCISLGLFGGRSWSAEKGAEFLSLLVFGVLRKALISWRIDTILETLKRQSWPPKQWNPIPSSEPRNKKWTGKWEEGTYRSIKIPGKSGPSGVSGLFSPHTVTQKSGPALHLDFERIPSTPPDRVSPRVTERELLFFCLVKRELFRVISVRVLLETYQKSRNSDFSILNCWPCSECFRPL